MNSFYLVIPVVYGVFVIGVCVFLLLRGCTHSFLLFFGIAAFLHMIPPVGVALLQASGHRQWWSALSLVGTLGTLSSVAAFLSLASFLLGLQRGSDGPEAPAA